MALSRRFSLVGRWGGPWSRLLRVAGEAGGLLRGAGWGVWGRIFLSACSGLRNILGLAVGACLDRSVSIILSVCSSRAP